MASDWELTEADRELFDRELQSFVPDQVFDAHAHWYQLDQFAPGTAPLFLQAGPVAAGFESYQAGMAELTPGRTTAGVFFPYPHPHLDIAAGNAFLARELQHAPGSRGQMLVTPSDDPDFIREQVQQHGFVGLKCYHLYATTRPTFQASIDHFLPDSQLRIADELGLSITLHMVRPQALADPVNQDWIRSRCERYPGLQLILAHAARGFNPHHTITGIHSIAGLENVWFDTSVVTDSGAIEAIARVFGHQKLLYGSDYPVSQLRGRCVALGDSFFWISAQNTNLQVPYADLQLSLVGHEALRTLKVAALALGWSDTQVEDVFHNNARRLWQLA